MLASHQPLSQVQHIVVTQAHAGQRIDNFLSRMLSGVPKSRIYRMIRSGELRVNKGRSTVSYRLAQGDTLRIPPLRIHLKNQVKMPLPGLIKKLQAAILYEDEQLIVIDKPQGLAVHGGSGISLGLIEAIRATRPKGRFLELVHRLDRETSGCVMIAKTRSLLTHLHDCLRNGKIIKHYFVLVHGKWEGGTCVEAPLHKFVLKSGERMVKVDPHGKTAKTNFEIIETFSQETLLRAIPVTGRTHQIRVHCAFMGNPIVGDRKYGYRQTKEGTKLNVRDRLYLHANQLVIELPYAPYRMTITSPMPKAYEQFCKDLSKQTRTLCSKK